MKLRRVAFGILTIPSLLVSLPVFAANPALLIAPVGYQSNGAYGSTLSGLGDINGDGFGDFGVGRWIYFGGVSPDALPDQTLGSFGGSAVPNVMHGIGDMNGDGFDDFLVGAGPDYYPWHGFYFGGPSSPSTQPQIETRAYPVSHLNYPGSSLVYSPNSAAAGDLNGDGYDDVVIIGRDKSPRTYVLLGGANPDAIADRSLGPGPGAEAFGVSVAGAGDLDGDGYDDLILGGRCSAYIFFGGAVLDTIPGLTLAEPCDQYGYGFGYTVAGGIDVNADGFDDVIVANPFFDGEYENGGQIYVYFGGATMDSVADAILPGGAADARWGVRLAGLGDMDGDGFGDFIAGTDTHRVLLYHGGHNSASITRQVIPQQELDEDFGHIGWAGDLNGDGNAEFLVGAPFNDVAGPNFGRAYVFTGYVQPLAVQEAPSLATRVLVMNNPVLSGRLRLTLSSPETGMAGIDLLNVTGARIATLELGSFQRGESRDIHWSLPRVSSGTYFMRMRVNDKPVASRQIVLLR